MEKRSWLMKGSLCLTDGSWMEWSPRWRAVRAAGRSAAARGDGRRRRDALHRTAAGVAAKDAGEHQEGEDRDHHDDRQHPPRDAALATADGDLRLGHAVSPWLGK